MANKRHQQTASGRTVWFGSDAPGELQKLASDLGEPKPFHECRACVDDDSNVPLGFVSWAENLMMVGMAVWMILKPIGMTH